MSHTSSTSCSLKTLVPRSFLSTSVPSARKMGISSGQVVRPWLFQKRVASRVQFGVNRFCSPLDSPVPLKQEVRCFSEHFFIPPTDSNFRSKQNGSIKGRKNQIQSWYFHTLFNRWGFVYNSEYPVLLFCLVGIRRACAFCSSIINSCAASTFTCILLLGWSHGTLTLPNAPQGAWLYSS